MHISSFGRHILSTALFVFVGFAITFGARLSAQTVTLVRFDQLTPTVTGPGSISYRGSSQDLVAVNTVEGFGLAALQGGNPNVMSIPAFASTGGFRFNTGVAVGNGGGAYINDYTMIFDIYWATSASWAGLFNAEGINDNDADFFRRGSDGAIGVGSDGYFGSAPTGEWNRIAFTVSHSTPSSTQISIYLNGTYLGTSDWSSIGIDGRFSLYLSGDNVANQTALLTDNDGETGSAYISQFLFSDTVYSADQIAALGGASATSIGSTIPEPATCAFLIGTLGLTTALFRRQSRALRSAT